MTYITHSILPRDWWPFPPPRLDAQRMATHNQTTEGNSVRFDIYNIKMVTKKTSDLYITKSKFE